ncbi:exosortase A [Rubrivivax sp. RP6-9]|uniref:exosortase A n=1 Tax=Rubrivivax sp. RP6-9 TaxID=3415750 RepID=UPI003CC6CCC8
MSALMHPAPDAGWRQLLPGLVLALLVLVVFHETTQAMVSIWHRSDTYAHAFLVPPISAWLIWRRRALLVGLPARPQPWMLLPLSLLCLLWLIGELAAANSVTQFALVAILVTCVPLALGLQVTRVLMFPLAFLFFAVPLGESLVPLMMEWTADFTVAAVRLSGVPVYREGLQFVVPTGRWSVVEACSGVRYLIASFMVGTLYAYLNYSSWRRRVAFISLALVVPLLANWLRAYFIVMLGHLSNNELAAGVDHILYGWVFFGIVIGLMFFIGARWSQPPQELPTHVPGPEATLPRLWTSGAIVLAVAVVAMTGTQQVARQLNLGVVAAKAPMLELPTEWVGGWVLETPPIADWVPAFSNPRVAVQRTYRRGNDVVGVWIGYYRNQTYDNKLVNSSNVLAQSTIGSAWAQANRGQRRVADSGNAFDVRVADVHTALAGGSLGTQRMRAWQVYWVGGQFIAGDARARLQFALNRLVGRGDDGAVVVFYTAGEPPEAADARLDGFVNAGVQALADRLAATQAAR